MSESLARQLTEDLRKALSAGGVKALAIGEAIYKLQKSRAYLDLGFQTFNAFLKEECNMKSATAVRYAYKYEISKTYPEQRDNIGRAHIVACEHARRLMMLEGGKPIVDGFIERIGEMSVGEVKKIYADFKPKKDSDVHFKRISATFMEEEHEEFLELEELIMKGMDLTNRREVILNSMRDMAVQAREALVEAGAKGE